MSKSKLKQRLTYPAGGICYYSPGPPGISCKCREGVQWGVGENPGGLGPEIGPLQLDRDAPASCQAQAAKVHGATSSACGVHDK